MGKSSSSLQDTTVKLARRLLLLVPLSRRKSSKLYTTTRARSIDEAPARELVKKNSP